MRGCQITNFDSKNRLHVKKQELPVNLPFPKLNWGSGEHLVHGLFERKTDILLPTKKNCQILRKQVM